MASAGSPSNDAPPSSNPPVDATPLPPTNFPRDFRRARAGTLPSNVQLAAQHYAAASETLQSLPSSTDSFLDTYATQQQQQQQVTINSGPALSSVRPGLRHATTTIASTAANAAVTERNSRFRSGSLTSLPGASLSNAFGGSPLYSTSWLSNNRNGSNLPGLDEHRSIASMDSGGDEFDVHTLHTLDYLGVDDNLPPPPPAATLSELRNRTQAAIAGNLAASANPARNRSVTISDGLYRMKPAAASMSLLATPSASEEEELLDAYGQNYGHQHMDKYDNTLAADNYYQTLQVARGFKPSQHLTSTAATGTRPRAISVGILDDPSRSVQRIGYDTQQTQYGVELLGGQNTLAGTVSKLSSAQSGSSRYTANDPTSARASTNYLAAPPTQTRAISPKSEGSSTQIQAPTRSLWIGNLDSSVTSEQLIHVFAPYGAIESLRLLPEKVNSISECFLMISF